MHSSSMPCRGQQEVLSNGGPAGRVACPARRHVLRRQRLEEVQPIRLLPSPQHNSRSLVRARVAEDTRIDDSRIVKEVKTTFPSVSGSMDYELLFNSSPDCPLGGVAEVMRSNARGVLSCMPTQTLESVIPLLSRVTGLPVLNKDGRVVGVISRKDIIRVRKAEGSLQDPVEAHMTKPAITIAETASVQEAANLMLERKIRRLPVVDERGLPVGILARSDIFKPLFVEAYTQYMDMEAAAVQGLTARGVTPEPGAVVKVKTQKKITWSVKYLYDGDCAMCQSLKNVLKRQDRGRGKIKFVNIASPDYNPSKNMGIEYEEAMSTIHAIRPDGEVLYGTDALRAMFSEVGLGWAANLSESPILSKIVDIVYNFLSTNRISLGGTLDAIIAAKRVEMSKEGVETCGDLDEECHVEW